MRASDSDANSPKLLFLLNRWKNKIVLFLCERVIKDEAAKFDVNGMGIGADVVIMCHFFHGHSILHIRQKWHVIMHISHSIYPGQSHVFVVPKNIQMQMLDAHADNENVDTIKTSAKIDIFNIKLLDKDERISVRL